MNKYISLYIFLLYIFRLLAKATFLIFIYLNLTTKTEIYKKQKMLAMQ